MASAEHVPLPESEKVPRKKRVRRPSRLPSEAMPANQLHQQEVSSQVEERLEPAAKKRRKRRAKKQTEPTHEIEVGASDTNSQEATESEPKVDLVRMVAEDAQVPETDKKSDAADTEELLFAETLDNELVVEAGTAEVADAYTASEFTAIPLHEQEASAELFVSPRLSEAASDSVEDIDTQPVVTSRRHQATAAGVVGAGHTTQFSQPATAPHNPNIMPPVPPNPTMPPVGGANLPPQSPSPNTYYGGAHGGNVAPSSAAPNFAPAIPSTPTERVRVIERGSGRAILAGILVGGLIEHVRHTRREKKREKAHKKEIKALKTDHEFTREQLHKSETRAERTKTSLEKQLTRLEQALPVATQSPRPERLPQPVRQHEGPASIPIPLRERQPDNPLLAPRPVQSEVKLAVPPKAELLKSPDAVPEIPSDRKVETSAWHRIEIDKKTGQAVENPTVLYGEEFQHEQHQEQLRRAIDEASMDSDTVRRQYASPLGTVATDASAQQHSQQTKSPTAKSKSAPVFDHAKQALQRSEPVDIALWVGLALVVLAIAAVLF